MTAPAIQFTEITLEDIAPPCGWIQCDHTAEWVAVWSCGCVFMYCDPHKEAIAACKNVACDKHGNKKVYVRMATVERL